MQQAIAEADGIDYLFSTSVQGSSTIGAHMVLDYDPKAAVAEIQAKVESQRNVLPADAEDPVIDATTGDSTALMYMAFYSGTMSLSQITDYLPRVVWPQLQAVPGVAKAQLIGNKTFAMRAAVVPAVAVSLDSVYRARQPDILDPDAARDFPAGAHRGQASPRPRRTGPAAGGQA